MRLWQRASGAFKDHNSLWQTNLSSRCTCTTATAAAFRNLDIEKAVIRSTSHSDLCFNRRSVHRVCEWLRLSPYNLVPLLQAVSRRMSKTRNWIVALKGLYLMHSVINSRLPCVKAIGRLPFDLSDFNDGYSPKARSWPFNAFVRAYYAFLDQKSVIIFLQGRDVKRRGGDGDGDDSSLIAGELAMLQKLQALIDLLLQIRPQSRAAFVPIVLEVMDWIIIEIYDLYSRICRGIALVLLNIYSGGKAEAKLALSVVQKANQQGEDLYQYLHFCRKLGISHSSAFPAVDPIPKDTIHELEQIINRFSHDEEAKRNHSSEEEIRHLTYGFNVNGRSSSSSSSSQRDQPLKAIISGKWEKFEEETVRDAEIPDLISL
ncbi:putative clathrin assembly protein At1g25240 [Andrographis paniculata]|uniref:putative clathrin assembly protein At1g25240 n=1 Tax=Andrographis paniculata TaxID=175694 RepID=UPI0021E75984|nr:putative clathrin assembly protein At1g25240 [Andrographis paniculata]